MQPSAGTLKQDFHDVKSPGSGGVGPPKEKRTLRFTHSSGSRPLEGYTIKRGIGIGGFGEVYFALSDAGKEVALKRIQRNLDIELRGVRQCLNLKHVNLISLWDIRSNHEGESWVVMEYVPGHSLREVLEVHPDGMPEEEVKRWFTSIAAGVCYLHDHGIVHRDLKPGNVFHDTDEQVIKIGDYGLSKFISCSRRSGQTESVGTFHYMAPEIGKGVYGKEIDIYALGVMLYEMISGRLPFDGESSQEIIMKHLTAEPDLGLIPERFRSVIERALLKDPETRYRTVSEMCTELPWADIAQAAQTIVNRHAIGPMSSQRDIDDRPTQVEVSRAARSSEPAPAVLQDLIFLENQNYVPDQPEIVFGPLKNNSHVPAGGGPSQFTNLPPNPSLRMPLLAVASNLNAATRGRRPEPIAQAVRGGMSGLLGWWNNPELTTPTKVFAVVVVAVILILNSAWLIPVALGLGLIYLMYYFIRSLFMPAAHEAAPVLSKRELRHQQLFFTRQWLGNRPLADRATELIGSMLVSAVSVAVLSLSGLIIGQTSFSTPSLDAWALYSWMAVTSVAASWSLLIASKSWEHREGDGWLRRLTMTGLGVAIGLGSYALAGVLNVNLGVTEQGLGSALPRLETSVPLANYLVLFAALFGVLRWWKQADPIRKTRLSLITVGLCLVFSVIFSHILGFEPMWHGIIGGVVCVSTQLAAPWIVNYQREQIHREALSN